MSYILFFLGETIFVVSVTPFGKYHSVLFARFCQYLQTHMCDTTYSLCSTDIAMNRSFFKLLLSCVFSFKIIHVFQAFRYLGLALYVQKNCKKNRFSVNISIIIQFIEHFMLFRIYVGCKKTI